MSFLYMEKQGWISQKLCWVQEAFHQFNVYQSNDVPYFTKEKGN